MSTVALSAIGMLVFLMCHQTDATRDDGGVLAGLRRGEHVGERLAHARRVLNRLVVGGVEIRSAGKGHARLAYAVGKTSAVP
jgi:hypothetical protein